MAAHVKPGPSIEGAFFDVRHVVGHEVVAETIALVHRRPELAGLRLNREPDGVANAGRVDAAAAAVRIELVDDGALALDGIVLLVDVGHRSDRHVHLPAVARERDVARPVLGVGRAAARQRRDNDFLRTARLQIAAAIGIANDRVRVADVDVRRIRARWIEGDAERPLETAREHVGGERHRIAVERDDAPRLALRDEHVAVRRRANHARILESVGVHRDVIARQHLELRVKRPIDELRRIPGGARGARRRQIAEHDLVHDAGAFAAKVREGRLIAQGGRRSQQ